MPILDIETSVFPETLLEEGSPYTTPRCSGVSLDGVSLDGVSLDGESVAEPSECGWWVAHTKARQEKSLARELVRDEVPFYLPLVASERLIRGRRVRSWNPLFSGYVFLFGDKFQHSSWRLTNRICNLLPVEDGRQLVVELRTIKGLIEADAALTVERRLEAGRRVRVTTGAFAGAEGTVITRRGRSRLFVAVTLLQQGVSLEIDDFMLEPID